MSCLIPYNSGDVRIQRDETEEALLQGAEISSGDVIKTGSDGKVVLFLPDGSELELQVDTLVKLEELLEAASIKIRLLAGKIWLHVKSIAEALRARDGFEVATPIGHTGVRGTEFMVEVAEDGTTTLVVIEGLVEFSDLQQIKKVTVGQNQILTCQPNGVPSDPSPFDPDQIQQWWEETTPTEPETTESPTKSESPTAPTVAPTFVIPIVLVVIVSVAIIIGVLLLRRRSADSTEASSNSMLPHH